MGKTGRTSLLAALSPYLSWANRHSGMLLVAGLVGVGFKQWRLWKVDKKRLAEITPLPPLPELETWPRLPLVSVLVAAWNEAENIVAHIESFQALRYSNKQLVLVAGGDDGTTALAKYYEDQHIYVLEQYQGEGKQSSLRRGLAVAVGEIIYLTDADCILNDQAFETILEKIILQKEEAVTGVYAPQNKFLDHPFVQTQWFIDHYGRQLSGDYVEGIIGRNAAVTRDLVRQCGDFSQNVQIGTDYYLAQQILTRGRRITFARNSVVQTVYHTNIKKYIWQQSRWLRNLLIHGTRFGKWKQVLNALMQPAIALLFWGLALFGLMLGPIFAVLWVLMFIYGGIARFRYLRFSSASLGIDINPRTYLLIPWYFLVDQFMLINVLVTWLSPKTRKLW